MPSKPHSASATADGGVTATQLIEQTPITAVWAGLGGGEIKNHRARAFWRPRADGRSVVLNNDKGAWYDFRDSTGGGVLDLIQHVRGGSRGDAVRWLADWRGIPLKGATFSAEDRRRYAHAQQIAPQLAHEAELWGRERRAELDEIKAAALERNDIATLAWAASEAHLLGLLVPEGIIRAYQRARMDEPEHTAALVHAAETWERIAQSLITLLIARWAREAGA